MARMLTDAEYQEIMQRRAILQGNIDGAERDEEKFEDMAKAAHARKEDAEARLELYDNFLSDAVEEYLEAHPPEEPPE